MYPTGNYNIAVACGGTGGHIFPGLVTAKELRRRGHAVTLWLSGRDVEATSVKGWEGPIERVRSAGFPPGFSPGVLRSAWSLAGAFFTCRERMSRNRPDALLAMGSYASVGPALAARSLGVPIVLHEANAIPGRAVEFLSRFATAVGVTFESSVSWLHCKRIVRTGLPIRDDLKRCERRPCDRAFTVLAMGGSQGAQSLNRIVADAFSLLAKKGQGIPVVHLTGTADEDRVRAQYEEAGAPHRVHGFLHDMAGSYGEADLAISRAGAGACMELAMCGVPAILVPLPWSMRGHQAANAEALAKAGAALVIAQDDLTVERLAETVTELHRDQERRARMSAAMLRFAISDATARLADLVSETVEPLAKPLASPARGGRHEGFCK